jgi:formate dehydrogenase subunit gamma
LTPRVVRFGRTARFVHAVQAVTFLTLLVTGLSEIYLSGVIGERALLRQVHLTAAFFFVFGPPLIALAGDHLAIRRDIGEIDTWTKSDRVWLRKPALKPRPGTPPPGRFNAGQKLNAIFTVYCTLAFAASGLILWQNPHFPRPLVSTANDLHEILAYVAAVVFAGHLALAVAIPSTRKALRGVIDGTVGAEWAREHYPKWLPQQGPEPALRIGEVLRSAVLLLLGLEAAGLLVRFGFEWLGAVVTDPTTKFIYRFTNVPGTIQHQISNTHQLDYGAIFWFGLVVALWYGVMRRYRLLPHTLPTPASG